VRNNGTGTETGTGTGATTPLSFLYIMCMTPLAILQQWLGPTANPGHIGHHQRNPVPSSFVLVRGGLGSSGEEIFET